MTLFSSAATQREKRAARQAVLNSPDVLHFLHIGKCAGTQIGKVIAQINKIEVGPSAVKHNHDRFLRDLPGAARYFFSIRDPISRFRSGFYSRKRKGQPRLFSEWTAYEAVAFAGFAEANDLAEALFTEGARGREAAAAIKSIRHTAQNQVDWFYGCGSFLTVRPPVWIIRQGHFADDLEHFLIAAGYDHLRDRLKLAFDPVTSHANDYGGTPPLSQKAKENLRIWYAQDVQFYQMCEAWLGEHANKAR